MYHFDRENLTASRNGGHANLPDHEISDLEVAAFGLDVFRVFVVGGEVDATDVNEEEVGASGFDELEYTLLVEGSFDSENMRFRQKIFTGISISFKTLQILPILCSTSLLLLSQ